MTLQNPDLHSKHPIGHNRILVAEDDLAVRSFISRALEQAGYDVLAVEDGYLALEALKRNTYHVLITDIRMPEMDGIALTLKAVRDYPQLQIVMITGYATEQQRAYQNFHSRVHSILQKPFTLKQIQEHVAAALMKALIAKAA